MALGAGFVRRQKTTREAEQKYQADVALAARLADLLDAARKAESRLREAQAWRAPEEEIRHLAKDLDAALTAAMHAAYAAQRAEIGPRGYDDRIYRRKAKAKPGVHALTAEAEHLLTLRETHRLNSIPAVALTSLPIRKARMAGNPGSSRDQQGMNAAPIGDVLKEAAAFRQLAIHKDNSHYAMAQRLETRNKVLGVPVIVTTAIVSTAIFSTVETQTAIGWKVATGLVSVAAAVLAALQTFFNYADQAQQHRSSSRAYSQLRRRLELFVLRNTSGQPHRDQALRELNELAQQMDELEKYEPTINSNVYEKTKKRYSALET